MKLILNKLTTAICLFTFLFIFSACKDEFRFPFGKTSSPKKPRPDKDFSQPAGTGTQYKSGTSQTSQGTGNGNGAMDVAQDGSPPTETEKHQEQKRRIKFNEDISLFDESRIDESGSMDAYANATRQYNHSTDILSQLKTWKTLDIPGQKIYFAKEAMSSSDPKQTQDHVLLYYSKTENVFSLKFRIISAVRENFEEFKLQLIRNGSARINGSSSAAHNSYLDLAEFMQTEASEQEEEFDQIPDPANSSEKLTQRIETVSICRPMEVITKGDSTDSENPRKEIQPQCAMVEMKVRSTAKFLLDGTLLIKLEVIEEPGLTYILNVPLTEKTSLTPSRIWNHTIPN